MCKKKYKMQGFEKRLNREQWTTRIDRNQIVVIEGARRMQKNMLERAQSKSGRESV